MASLAAVDPSTVHKWMHQFSYADESSSAGAPTLAELGFAGNDLFGPETVVISVPHDEQMFTRRWLGDPDVAGAEVSDINPVPANTPGFELDDELFRTDETCLTRGVAMSVSRKPEMLEWLGGIFQRHQRGDWGDLPDKEDVWANNGALRHGYRLMSSYDLPDDLKGIEGASEGSVWIITDEGPSAQQMGRTTILFPDEY